MAAEVLPRRPPSAPMTTLQLGWVPPRASSSPPRTRTSWAQVRDATRSGGEVLVLGGGSNLGRGRRGVRGHGGARRVAGRGRHAARGGRVLLDLAAGEDWDALVARAAVDEGLGGHRRVDVEASLARSAQTPIQNVGAYGQEVSETLVHVTAYDRDDDTTVTLPAAASAASGYRASRFKGASRFVVLRVTLATRPPPYGERPLRGARARPRSHRGTTLRRSRASARRSSRFAGRRAWWSTRAIRTRSAPAPSS